MLYLPKDSLERTASIVGIDPGSETLGLSIINFDIDSFKIESTYAQTFIGSKMFDADNWLSVIHSPRVARINSHKENLVKIFNSVNPLVIACESSFYNPRRPNAYAVLIEVLTAVREAVMEYDIWKPLYLIDPPTVKKSVGAPGNADKVKMLECVCNLTQLNYSGDVPIQELDEHSIDAIAVAYCKYVNLIKN